MKNGVKKLKNAFDKRKKSVRVRQQPDELFFASIAFDEF